MYLSIYLSIYLTSKLSTYLHHYLLSTRISTYPSNQGSIFVSINLSCWDSQCINKPGYLALNHLQIYHISPMCAPMWRPWPGTVSTSDGHNRARDDGVIKLFGVSYVYIYIFGTIAGLQIISRTKLFFFTSNKYTSDKTKIGMFSHG